MPSLRFVLAPTVGLYLCSIGVLSCFNFVLVSRSRLCWGFDFMVVSFRAMEGREGEGASRRFEGEDSLLGRGRYPPSMKASQM